MLQVMREKMQGWIAGIIVTLLIVALGFWGISYYLHDGSSQGNVIATFEGGSITQQQLDSAYNRYRLQSREQLPTQLSAVAELKQNILNQLITQQLLSRAASDNHFSIGQSQINSVLLSIPYFQENGQFSQARFQAVVQQLLFTVPEFLQNLTQTMLVNQLQSGMFSTAFVLPNEIQSGLALVNQKRDYSYAILPYARLLKNIRITPEEINQYYTQHKQQFMLPETVKIEYVTLSAASIMDSIDPTSQQLQQFYQNNISDYMQPAKWHVAHILLTGKNAKNQADKVYQQVKAGANFTSLVKKYSQDALSVKQNGVLPWFSAGQLDPNFESAVANLQVGQVSQPVQTKYGYEVIKLLAQQKQQPLPYKQVMDKVRKAYLSQKTQKQFSNMKDQLANISFETPNSLKPVEKFLKTQSQTTAAFTRKGTSSGIAKLPQVVAAAFSSDVLAGDNSDVVTIAPGKVAVLRVVKHQPAELQALSKVSGKIKQILSNAKASDAAKVLADNVQQAFNSGSSMAQIAKQYGLDWRKVSSMQRSSAMQNNNIGIEAFNLARPVANKPTVGYINYKDNDYAIIAVTNVIDGSGRDVAKREASAFTGIMQKSYGELDYSEYVKYLHDNANVKFKQAHVNDK